MKVLMIDDDREDIELTKDMMTESKITIDLDVAFNGKEALDKLKIQKKDDQKDLPDLILLDLNMPVMDGGETLEKIKSDPVLRKIPVIILTTSSADEDIAKSYDLGASSYVNKPVGLDQFRKIVTSIEDFWLTVVRFPSKE